MVTHGGGKVETLSGLEGAAQSSGRLNKKLLILHAHSVSVYYHKKNTFVLSLCG